MEEKVWREDQTNRPSDWKGLTESSHSRPSEWEELTENSHSRPLTQTRFALTEDARNGDMVPRGVVKVVTKLVVDSQYSNHLHPATSCV